MEFLTLINKLEPYMERITRHYKQRNVDALIYNNTNNKTVTINSDDTYTPQAILVYNTTDHIEIAVQIYNTMHTYNTSDITTLVITWNQKKTSTKAAQIEDIAKKTKASVVICYLPNNAI